MIHRQENIRQESYIYNALYIYLGNMALNSSMSGATYHKKHLSYKPYNFLLNKVATII